jgi:hypothetical protein
MRTQALVVVVGLALLAAPAIAHDGSFTVDVPSFETIDGLVHTDADPWKGLATFTVTNNTGNIWTDFHFQITGAELDATLVEIVDPPTPTSTQSPFTYVIGETVDGFATIDYYFADDPVLPGQGATFTFYTDNQAAQNAWFGFCMYPTPEPATALLLSLGGVFVIRRRRA